MSRGHGYVQRRVMDEVTRLGEVDTFELTAAVFDVAPDAEGQCWLTRAQLGSVRRAIRNLISIGLISGELHRPRTARGKVSSIAEAERAATRMRRYYARHNIIRTILETPVPDDGDLD